jgi:hypothetical protein
MKNLVTFDNFSENVVQQPTTKKSIKRKKHADRFHKIFGELDDEIEFLEQIIQRSNILIKQGNNGELPEFVQKNIKIAYDALMSDSDMNQKSVE